MADVPSKPAGKKLVIGNRKVSSPWLDSVKAATGVDARELSRGTIYLLLDTSYSMSGPPIVEALEGVRQFNAKSLATGQSVGLICFSSAAEVIASPSRSGVAERLGSIECNGSTNMAAAIVLAIRDFEKIRGRRTIVLVTDGCPDDSDATLKAAQQAKDMGIRMLTIGTKGSDTRFLARLASSDDFAVVTASGTLGKALAASTPLLLK